MKILHVIAGTDPESGGPIEALLRISEVSLQDGHQVAVASLEDAGEITARKFPFPIIALGHGTRPYRFNPRLTQWLNRNSTQYDVVVLHGLWNYSSLGSWRALRKELHPVLHLLPWDAGSLVPRRYPLKHLAKQLFWTLAEGRVLRDAKAVLFTCEEERARSRDVFKGHRYKERVVLFGTADPEGNPALQQAAFAAAHPLLRDRQFLLFLSRIHPKKGCDLMIQAFAELLPELPANLDLVIAGPDQVGWIPELQSLTKQLGIETRVHWPGMLKDDVKWGAFRSAQALLLPSHQENFGFVVAEAMACSTPVLISNKVNIWREVQSASAGLVEPDTLEGTRSLIRRFNNLSDQQRAQMRQDARAGFLKYFDVRVTARDFIQAIEPEHPANQAPRP